MEQSEKKVENSFSLLMNFSFQSENNNTENITEEEISKNPYITKDHVPEIEMINKTVGELIKTLTSVIPEAIKEMIDLESMAKNDIEEVLRSTFEGAVYEQNDAFVEELNKSIENCQLQD